MSYLTNQILRGAATIRRNSSESNKNTDNGFNKNMTADTPRTDAYARHWPSETECVPSTIARQLERELNERYKALSEADERAEKAEAEVERLMEIIESL